MNRLWLIVPKVAYFNLSVLSRDTSGHLKWPGCGFYMGVGTRAAGAAAGAPIFLPIIKIGIYRKTKMKKKG